MKVIVVKATITGIKICPPFPFFIGVRDGTPYLMISRQTDNPICQKELQWIVTRQEIRINELDLGKCFAFTFAKHLFRLLCHGFIFFLEDIFRFLIKACYDTLAHTSVSSQNNSDGIKAFSSP
jgi:hypothetical protein